MQEVEPDDNLGSDQKQPYFYETGDSPYFTTTTSAGICFWAEVEVDKYVHDYSEEKQLVLLPKANDKQAIQKLMPIIGGKVQNRGAWW